jgi:hypothetical protein
MYEMDCFCSSVGERVQTAPRIVPLSESHDRTCERFGDFLPVGFVSKRRRVFFVAEKPDLDQRCRHLHAHQNDEWCLFHTPGRLIDDLGKFGLGQFREGIGVRHVVGADHVSKQGEEGILP